MKPHLLIRLNQTIFNIEQILGLRNLDGSIDELDPQEVSWIVENLELLYELKGILE